MASPVSCESPVIIFTLTPLDSRLDIAAPTYSVQTPLHTVYRHHYTQCTDTTTHSVQTPLHYSVQTPLHYSVQTPLHTVYRHCYITVYRHCYYIIQTPGQAGSVLINKQDCFQGLYTNIAFEAAKVVLFIKVSSIQGAKFCICKIFLICSNIYLIPGRIPHPHQTSK